MTTGKQLLELGERVLALATGRPIKKPPILNEISNDRVIEYVIKPGEVRPGDDELRRLQKVALLRLYRKLMDGGKVKFARGIIYEVSPLNDWERFEAYDPGYETTEWYGYAVRCDANDFALRLTEMTNEELAAILATPPVFVGYFETPPRKNMQIEKAVIEVERRQRIAWLRNQNSPAGRAEGEKV